MFVVDKHDEPSIHRGAAPICGTADGTEDAKPLRGGSTPPGRNQHAHQGRETISRRRKRHDECSAVVKIDGPGWKEKLRLAKQFFVGAAGYCSDADYKRWFK